MNNMFHIPFLGQRPSNFKVNEIVKGFIISETFFWSGINLISPVFAIFVANQMSGGSIEAAASSVSIYMFARIIAELIVAKSLDRSSDRRKFVFSILGIVFIAILHLAFAFAESILFVYVLQFLIGVGHGVISPAKYGLFSEHIDKGRESSEWSVYDAATFSGMALAAALGGFIAEKYGFDTLFILAAIFILLGSLPFILFYKTSVRNGLK